MSNLDTLTRRLKMRSFRLLVLTLALSIIGLLATSFAAPANAANAKAYYKVTHRDTGGNDVAVADGYTVEYRLYHSVDGWGTWTGATSTGVSDASCTYGTWRWKYETANFDDTVITQIEWRATVPTSRAGTRCSNGASKSYAAGETLNKLTIPNGTATNTFSNYQ
jgi:hypothetical protein